MPDRVGVFFDYQNVLATARHCFHSPPYSPADGQVDPAPLGELLVRRRTRTSVLSEVRVYRGLPDRRRQPRAYGANERQALAWTTNRRVTVVRRPLRYPAGWPSERPQEKGIDVALAIDVVRLALAGRCDVAILMSTDTDLLPALEVVREMPGMHVEVAAWKPGIRLSYPGTALPWCHRLDRGDYDLVRDTRDYGRA